MKFIKKINEFFNPEEEIESEYFNLHDEEDQDPEDGNFYSHEDDESSHTEEENWGDEGDSSIGSNSRISSFGDFNSEGDDDYATHDGNFGGDDSDDYKTFNHSDEEDDIHLQHRNMISDEEFNKDDEDGEGFQEEGFVESFKAFNEKKVTPAQKKARDAFAKRIKGENSKKKSGKGLTAAQKAIEKKNNKK